jgi:hypothetical protein
VPLGLQPICEQRQQSDGPGEIDLQRFHCLLYLLLATLLIRKRSVRHQDHIDLAESGEGRLDHTTVGGKIGDIKGSCLDPSRSPHSEVVRYRGQAPGIPTGQEKVGSVPGEFLCRFTSDG